MRRMSPAPRTTTDAEHEVEVARQAEIAAAVAEPTPPDADEAPVAEPDPEAKTITLRSLNVDEYPLTVSVVGTDDLIFDSADATVDVTPAVAEQVAYLSNVEVAE